MVDVAVVVVTIMAIAANGSLFSLFSSAAAEMAVPAANLNFPACILIDTISLYRRRLSGAFLHSNYSEQARKFCRFPRCGFSPNEFIKNFAYECKHPTQFFYKFTLL